MAQQWMLASTALHAGSLPADDQMRLAVEASVFPLVETKIRIRRGTVALAGQSVLKGARCACDDTEDFAPAAGWIGASDLSGLELSRTLVIGAAPPDILSTIEAASTSKDSSSALNWLSHILSGWGFDVGNSAVAEGFLTQTDDMAWTSFSPRLGRYVGLHLDSWDALDDANRDSGTLRCCVNLGESQRHFVMATFSAQHLIQTLTKNGMGLGVGLAKASMFAFPDLPLVDVPQLPGHIYIAPTENVIHDGYRTDTSLPDQTFAIRAHLRLFDRGDSGELASRSSFRADR